MSALTTASCSLVFFRHISSSSGPSRKQTLAATRARRVSPWVSRTIFLPTAARLTTGVAGRLADALSAGGFAGGSQAGSTSAKIATERKQRVVMSDMVSQETYHRKQR